MEKLLRLRNKKGFTLIELIVVIVIIAILAAIAIPAIIGYRRDARMTTAEANARTLYTAVAAAQASYPTGAVTSTQTTAAALKTSAVDVMPVNFLEKVGELLGASFPGGVSWIIAGGRITSVTWSEAAAVHGGNTVRVTFNPTNPAGPPDQATSMFNFLGTW